MKRHIGLLLMICIVFAFFGCQMQENIESQGSNNTLEASSQANNSSCASSSKHDEANSQGSSSEATGISSSSSAIGNIPKPLYSEAFYQKRIESLNTSDAFYNEEYTRLYQQYVGILTPLQEETTLPMKAFAPYARSGNQYYSYMEALVHFQPCEGVTLTPQSAGSVNLTMGTFHATVSLYEDKNEDMVENIAQYISWGAYKDEDVSGLFGRPAYLKASAVPINDEFQPIEEENIKEFTYRYYLSFGQLGIKAVAYFPKDEQYIQKIQAFEQMLMTMRIDNVVEYFPNDIKLLKLPQFTDSRRQPDGPDKGPVNIVVKTSYGTKDDEDEVRVSIGNMDRFALYDSAQMGLEFAYFLPDNTRLEIPYTNLSSLYADTLHDPVADMQIQKANTPRYAQTDEEKLYKLNWPGYMYGATDCSNLFNRPAICWGFDDFVPDGPVIMGAEVFIPEFPDVDSRHYHIDYGEYVLLASIHLPTENSYRTGSLYNQLLSSFEEMLKSVTIEEATD